MCEKEISGDMDWMKQRACISQETLSCTMLKLQKIASHPVTKFTPQYLNFQRIWLETFHIESGWKLFCLCYTYKSVPSWHSRNP